VTRKQLESARYEVKFIASPDQYFRVEHWIAMHPAGFHAPYPPRQVNNVYFDDFNLYACAENLSGTSARSKVRLRWYGDTFRPESCVLEVKQKRNMLGWKYNFRAGAIDFESQSWLSIRRSLRSQLAPEGRSWLDETPQPVLLNRYRRKYYLSRDAKVRVTLDSNQQVFDQRVAPRPNLRRAANLPQTIVVEFKFGREDYAIASKAIQGIPIRVSRNSKYVIGVQALLAS
jgi:hypothetical protein